MAKKYKIALSVLLVVLLTVAVLLFTGVFDINKILGRDEKPSGNSGTLLSSYKDTYKSTTDISLPLMKTDIDGVFFTMTKDGKVRFYKVENGGATEIAESGSYEVSAECSGQKIPAVIHYIEQDGKVNGFGLYTSALYENVYLYDYAFFKVCNMFENFGDSGDLLLMIDVESDRFYSDNKIYSEIFTLSSDHKAVHFLSEDQRTVDMNARDRTDYKMFTDDILSQGNNKNVLFFSSRYYLMYEDSSYADIFTSGGSGTNIDNVRYVTDVAGLVFWRTDRGTYFFANNQDGTFSLCLFDGSSRSVIKTFSGDIDKDYIRSGSYLLNKTTGEIYSVLDGTMKTVIYSCFKNGFTPDKFTMSEDGRFCIIRGANTSNKAACGIMNFDTNQITAYMDDVFSYVAGMHMLNDGTAVITIANGESATAFYQLIADIA